MRKFQAEFTIVTRDELNWAFSSIIVILFSQVFKLFGAERNFSLYISVAVASLSVQHQPLLLYNGSFELKKMMKNIADPQSEDPRSPISLVCGSNWNLGAFVCQKLLK